LTVNGNQFYEKRFAIFREAVALAKPNLGDYSAVFFIRPDLSLKPVFFSYFELFEKMTFGFMAARTGFNRKGGDVSLICDVILYSPSDRFDLISDPYRFKLSEFWSGSSDGVWRGEDSDVSGNSQPYSNFGLMINTVAVTDTKVSVNPLFAMIGREHSQVVVDADFTMDDYIGNLSLGDDKPDTSTNAVIFHSKPTMIDAVRKAEVLIQSKVITPVNVVVRQVHGGDGQSAGKATALQTSSESTYGTNPHSA